MALPFLSTVRAASVRLTSALAAGSLAGLFAALLDAAWAVRVAEGASFGRLWIACAGLLAPLAIGAGLAAGAAHVFLHGTEVDGRTSLLDWLRRADRRRGLFLLLTPLAVVLWLLLSANLAVHVLSHVEAPVAAGIILSCAAALLAVLFLAGLIGVVHLSALRAPKLLERALPASSTGALAAVGLFGYAIGTGTTGGTGGLFAVFGVFKRPELDLRAPALLLVIALLAYVTPFMVRRLPILLSLLVGLLPLASTVAAALTTLDHRQTELAVTRGSALSKLVLAPLRHATDRDRDGFSRYFGGGDCDDGNADVNPGAVDIPGNGVDEDCSGADAAVSVDEPPVAPLEEATQGQAEWMAARLPDKPNVVLLTVDAMRFDIGYMGYQRPVTPNIDALARQGVVFEKSYALASYTAKSLPPMLIGKYTSETHRGWSHFNRFEPKDTFVQERLQRAGVRTISVQGYWYFYMKGYGFERGFDVLDSSPAPKHIAVKDDLSFNSDKMADAAIAQLSKPENTSGQFFLWMHFVDPHSEYVRHKDFDFGPSSRDRYDSELAFVDHHLGRVVDFIEKSEFGKRTIVIVSSDHGEAFGEKGMIRHGFEVWEPLVRVPFLVRVPDVEPRRIAQRRSLIDLVPTILDFYGIPQPDGAGTDFLSGRSLLKDVLWPPGHESDERLVFVDMSAGPHNAERQAYIEGGKKLIVSNGRPLGLYDVDADPEEKRDLLDDAAVREPLVERYKAFRRSLREVRVRPTE
jgi:arylsulfatase A-like enzyme